MWQVAQAYVWITCIAPKLHNLVMTSIMHHFVAVRWIATTGSDVSMDILYTFPIPVSIIPGGTVNFICTIILWYTLR